MMNDKITELANTIRDIPVVILAGGYGTRLMEETQILPKPMVTIGGKPVLLHIMRYYGAFGFRRFIICLGYKGNIIKEYFLNLEKYTSSLKIHCCNGVSEYEPTDMSDWETSLVETGEHSLTATRLCRVEKYINADNFCLTYGDGLSNLPLDKEVAFHLNHGKLGTIAAVHYPSRFGKLEIDEDSQVTSFREKQMLSHDYISGGFMIYRSEFISRLSSAENQSLEVEPLTKLAEDGELCAFKHDGFWMCMDTLRDRNDLEAIYNTGQAPWVIW